MIIHARNFVTSDDALGGSVIEKSLRFSRESNAVLYKAFSSAGNRKKWTWSGWVKFPNPEDSNTTQIFSYNQGNTNNRGSFYKGSSGVINYQLRVGGSSSQYRLAFVTTVAELRDPSAWYHIVLVIDSDQGSSTDRVKIYINGDLQPVVYHNGPSSGFSTWINSTSTIYFGGAADEDGGNMYLAEVNFIDGQAYDPLYFGYTDFQTKIWKPKRYEGTYGTNGFHLEFKDNSSVSALGKDTSGNGNDWTVSNFSVSAGDGNDSVTDTPTFTKATLNSITGWTNNATLKNGNLQMTGSAGFKEISTIAVDGTSKFYYESVRTISAGWQYLGVWIGQPDNPSNATSNTAIYAFASTEATSQGGVYSGSGSLSWGQDDVMGLKYENGTLKIYKNGTLHGNALTGIPTNDKVYAYIANDNTNAASFVRFNADSWTQNTAAGVDDSWELSIKNLPPNSPSIVRPQKHFDTVLFTGNGGTQSITGLEFQPDLVWIKTRSSSNYHFLFDSVRGVNKFLFSNVAAIENGGGANPDTSLTSFNPNGFSLGADPTPSTSTGFNKNGATHVAWCWKAGGAAVTNNDGSVASQVSVNTEAGFSIVTLDGTGSVLTFGHGLGAIPSMVILKARNIANNWLVYHKSYGAEKTTFLDTSTATSDNAQWYNDTEPTSSVFTLGTWSGMNTASSNIVAYCWTEIPGYSKFGSYTGNGSSDGTFVDLGFRPAWLMVKKTSGANSWVMYDVKRSTTNPIDDYLIAEGDDDEGTASSVEVDFLSNGFKFYSGYDIVNAGDYIYMAFAEQPGTTPFDTFPNARAT